MRMKRRVRARHPFEYAHRKNFMFINQFGADDVWRHRTSGDWYVVRQSSPKPSVWTEASLVYIEMLFRDDRRYVRDYRKDTVKFFNYLIAAGHRPFDGDYWRGRLL